MLRGYRQRTGLTGPSALLAVGLLVTSVFGAHAQQVAHATSGGLVGTVYDSLRSRPLGGAQVVLLGTPFRGVTNAEGAFLIPNLPVGQYRAAFVHQRLDSLTFVPGPVTVLVEPDTLTRVWLAIPIAIPIRTAQFEARKVAATLDDIGVVVDDHVRTLIDESVGIPKPMRVIGYVRDVATGRRIADVSVALQGTKFHTVSDGQGRFAFSDVPPGRYVLAAEMLGYAPRFEDLVVAAGRTVDVEVDLSTRPIPLPPLTVEVRSLSLERTGFYDRRGDPLLQGTFLERAEIERRAADQLGDLFREVPGARVDRLGMGDTRVRFLRAVSGGTSGQGCEPGVWVDGLRSRNPWNDIPVLTIEAIEAYVGATGPPQYNHSCGVVLVWTRRPV